ncbi:LOG family protein [Roseivirga sp. BDSF3-8]|uniref:LOG family protein n=1 Tax=Roseivirga sp. BDSF3-8 TaxID=3241598 RepID=UPI0035321FB0
MTYREIETVNELIDVLKKEPSLSYYAFQNLDFNEVETIARGRTFANCLFLGCDIPASLMHGFEKSSVIFPKMDMPFNVYPSHLYTRDTLMEGYVRGRPETYELTPDKVIYDYYLDTGKEAVNIKDTLARRLHDHSITDALYDFLALYDERKVVAIMGGHTMLRTNPDYLEMARVSKRLTEEGYLMISGGGPGAMEATHVGAYFAGKDSSHLEEAMDILCEAPAYTDTLWLDKAFEVIHRYTPSPFHSVGIPTWLYGHEPPTPFASLIAKYFANSVREDGLLAVAKGGVIYAPGSAGTIQEVFQDATQNHYLSFGYASPMVFFDSGYWQHNRPVYPLIKAMADEEKYENMILSLTDTAEEVIAEIRKFTS